MTHETKIVWHDLTEDPNDLPTMSGFYSISVLRVEDNLKGYFVDNAYYSHSDNQMYYPDDSCEIVAWAEQIKPYVPQEVSYAGNQ